MLLREFALDGHTISLKEEDELYIAQILNDAGEKVFYHEYKDYEKVKNSFNEIIAKLEKGDCSIDTAMLLLNESSN